MLVAGIRLSSLSGAGSSALFSMCTLQYVYLGKERMCFSWEPFILISPKNTAIDAVKKGCFYNLGQMQSDSFSFIMLHFSQLPQLLQLLCLFMPLQ